MSAALWGLGLLLAWVGLGWQAAPVLAQSGRERVESLIRIGDDAWRSGRFGEAKTAYGQVLSLDSAVSSRAVYRLGVMRSWDGDLKGAISYFQRYSRLEPRDEEGRLALAKAYAWNGQTEAAVAVYDSILARDRSYRDAALGAALAQAWAGRFAESVGRYDGWLAANPKDVEAELARARALAWWGKLGLAERTYAAIAARGERLEGYKGVALVAAWRGDLSRSERLWRDVTRRAPNDPEGWVGLGQVLRWAGRADQARDALRRALAADPKNADAAEQLRWVRADLSPAFDPAVSVTWDSDRNRSATASGGLGFRPFRAARLTIGGTRREAELADETATSTTGRAAIRLNFGGLTLAGDGGAVRTEGSAGTGAGRTVAVGGAAAMVRLGQRLSVGANVRSGVFDETVPLIRAGLDVRSAGAEAELRLASRWTLAGGGERASLRGGTADNERRSGMAALRWRAARSFTWSLAGRAFGYDRNPHEGYFAPSRYQLGEMVLRWAPGRDLGWGGVIETGFGAQRVTLVQGGAPDASATQRVAAGIVYRPRPGSELGLDYGFSNVSAGAGVAVGGSIYHSQFVNLRARFIF